MVDIPGFPHHRCLIGWIACCLILVSCGQVRDNGSGTSFRFRSAEFHYTEISGVGYEPGVTRRDPSDVICVADTFYVYYTKVFGRAPGYWGTIWLATSVDQGYSWIEQGEILTTGPPGHFDSFGVFTPNIFYFNGRYYLYYTGVRPTPGRDDGIFENNAVNDDTAIGVAISDNPHGPFRRVGAQPVLITSEEPAAFDSYRVDDAALLWRHDTIWLYYKGRSRVHGTQGPGKTCMGLAYSDHPAGAFRKTGYQILPGSHEVLVWPEGGGVAALASISSTIEFAPDGRDFTTRRLGLEVRDRPNAPGLYRPDLMDPGSRQASFDWGISMVHNGPECYLVRFECILNGTIE